MNDQEKQLAAEARNAYARKWRAANKDKVRASNNKYWLRKAAREAASKDTPEGDVPALKIVPERGAM